MDRFPIFVRAASLSTPTIAFTYMDAGATTLQGFGTHLRAYRELLRRLPEFDFIYVSPTERFFITAAAEFSRTVVGRSNPASNDQLRRYFRLRKTWEASERVPAADVVFLNAAKRDFDGEEVESQYRKWIEGAIEDFDVSQRDVPEAPHIQATFLTEKCGSSISVFHRSGHEVSESFDEMPSGGLSQRFSPEGSPA